MVPSSHSFVGMKPYLPKFCSLCESFPVFDHFFCNYCSRRVRDFLICPQWRGLKKISVFSLIQWDSGAEAPCRGLLYKVKEVRDVSFFDFFAAQFISQVNSELFKNAVFVSVPSSTGRFHSALMARCLSDLTGGDVCHGLQLDSFGRQPGLSRMQRLKRKVRSGEGVNLHSYNTVFLVDDVVTTGSTLLACVQALRPLNKVYGLTLFNRHLSTDVAS